MTTRSHTHGVPARAMLLVVAMAAAAAVGSYGLLSVASAQGSPVKALTMVLGPAFLVVALMRPDLAALLIPALVFSNAGFVLNANYNVPNITRAVLVLVTALLLTRAAWRSRILQATPVLWAGAMFVIVRLLSAVQSPGADVPTIAVNYVYGLLILLVVTALCSKAAYLRAGAFITVGTAAMVASATILRRQGIGGQWLGFAGDTPVTPELKAVMNRGLVTIDLAARVAGPVTDPNFWAQYLVLVTPLAIWALRGRSGLASRLLAAGALLAIVMGIFYTQSRGGALAALLGTTVWMWFQGGRARKAIILVPLAVAILFTSTGAAKRFSELKGITNPATAEDESIRGRLSENIAAFQMWRDNPVLGVGAEQYPPNYRRYAQRIGLDSRSARNAHNSYLQMAAESGTLGILAFVGMLVTGLIAGLRARLRLIHAGLLREAQLLEAVVAGLIGFSFAAVFLHQAWPDYLWLALGFIGGAWLLAERARTGEGDPA